MTSEVVDLSSIINGENNALAALLCSLKDQGWAIVSLPPEWTSLSTCVREPLLNYFKTDKSSNNNASRDTLTLRPKRQSPITGNNYWGRYEYPHKSGIRLLTGTELEPELIPQNVSDVIINLCNKFDQVLMDITKAIAVPFFGCSVEELGERGQLPGLLPAHQKVPRFAMFDVAYYENDIVDPEIIKAEKRPEDNCVAHYDPGLLSFSLLQTLPGLQLQDKQGNWVDAPAPEQTNLGVIWTGHAATELSNGAIKAGVHRVVYPAVPGTPRMSMWAEVCTRDQAVFSNSGFKKSIKGDTTYNAANKILVPNMPGRPYVIAVEEGKLYESLQLMEQLYGLPFSKIMRIAEINDKGEVTEVKNMWG